MIEMTTDQALMLQINPTSSLYISGNIQSRLKVMSSIKSKALMECSISVSKDYNDLCTFDSDYLDINTAIKYVFFEDTGDEEGRTNKRRQSSVISAGRKDDRRVRIFSGKYINLSECPNITHINLIK